MCWGFFKSYGWAASECCNGPDTKPTENNLAKNNNSGGNGSNGSNNNGGSGSGNGGSGSNGGNDSSNKSLAVRQGKINFEKPIKDLSSTEKDAVFAFSEKGFDVDVLLEANKKGIQNTPTPEFMVSGIGKVDVFTPQAVNPTSIARAIEKKVRKGQADSFVVSVPSSTNTATLIRSAKSAFNKGDGVGDKINRLFFMRNGELIEITRKVVNEAIPGK